MVMVGRAFRFLFASPSKALFGVWCKEFSGGSRHGSIVTLDVPVLPRVMKGASFGDGYSSRQELPGSVVDDSMRC